MPEGDTIHRAASALRRALGGRRVVRFATTAHEAAARAARTPVVGRVVAGVESRGKHLLVVFREPDAAEPDSAAPDAGERRAGGGLDLAVAASDLVLHTHMRMEGSWHLYRPGERWWRAAPRAVVVIDVGDFVAPCFDAPVVELLTVRGLARHPVLAALGPDAIAADFDAAEARRRMVAHPDLPVGVALLDQRLMSGIGNAHKSEALFAARVSPFARVGDLDPARLDAVIDESRRRLRQRRESPAAARAGWPRGDRPAVYGRRGRPCPACGTAIEMARQGAQARSTYFCPRCQPA